VSGLQLQSVLDALPGNAAIIDQSGFILLVNQSWDEFCSSNAGNIKLMGVGSNYFAPVHNAVEQCDQYAIKVEQGIKDILEQRINTFEIEYPCHSEDEERWFIMQMTEIVQSPPRNFLIIHKNITDLVLRERKVREAHKLEALGQLTGGIAHDFNNLFGVILGNLELMQMSLASPEALKKYISKASDAVDNGASLVRKLLSYARKQNLCERNIDIQPYLLDMVAALEQILSDNIVIEHDFYEKPLLVSVDTSILNSALLNIAINAGHAMLDGGKLCISTALKDLSYYSVNLTQDKLVGKFAEVAISDDGCGMTTDIVRKAIEPFFTTKEIGDGTGLGLSMVHGFMHQSRGYMDIQSQPDQGTTVYLYFPIADGESESAEEEQTEAQGVAAKPQKTVLLVEDEHGLRAVITENLKDLGYKVIPVANANSALDEFKRPSESIDAVLTDIMLTGSISGIELSRELMTIRPDIKIILMSGYPDMESAKTITNDDSIAALPFLGKPFTRDKLADALQALFSK